MKILVIEPDLVLAQTYIEVLNRAGHSAKSAHTAQDAVYHLDQIIPDLIIIEIQMANHNGVEFLYELRSYPEWQTIPVIVHSFVPKRLVQSQLTSRQLGIKACLYKPSTTLQQLVAAVSRNQSVFA